MLLRDDPAPRGAAPSRRTNTTGPEEATCAVGFDSILHPDLKIWDSSVEQVAISAVCFPRSFDKIRSKEPFFDETSKGIRPGCSTRFRELPCMLGCDHHCWKWKSCFGYCNQ